MAFLYFVLFCEDNSSRYIGLAVKNETYYVVGRSGGLGEIWHFFYYVEVVKWEVSD